MTKLKGFFILFFLVMTAGRVQGYELRAYEGKSGPLDDADLTLHLNRDGNQSNMFYGEQYSFNTQLEGGAGAWIQFGVTNMGSGQGTGVVSASFSPPKGKRIKAETKFSAGKWTWSDKPLKLEMGPNTLEFDGKVWTVHLDNPKFKADYVITNIGDSWKPGNGTVYYGDGSSTYYKIFLIAPRATITGTVTLPDGTQHQVQGFTLGDHSVTNMAPQLQARHWLKVRKIEKDSTVLLHCLHTPDSYGDKWVGWVMTAGKNGVDQVMVNPSFQFGEFYVDPDQDYRVPKVGSMESGNGFQGAYKATDMISREDKLASLDKAERMVVSKFVKPVSYKFKTLFEFRFPGGKSYKGRARLFFDQMF